MTWKPPQIDAVTLLLGSLVLIALVSAVCARGRDPISPIPEPTPISALQPALRACVAFVVVTLVGIATFAMLNPNGLRIGALIALSSITSFGGGEAYIAVADGYFVQPGYVDAGTFYTQLVPIANALPGPILVKVAAGIGYLTGGKHRACRLLAPSSCCHHRLSGCVLRPGVARTRRLCDAATQPHCRRYRSIHPSRNMRSFGVCIRHHARGLHRSGSKGRDSTTRHANRGCCRYRSDDVLTPEESRTGSRDAPYRGSGLPSHYRTT